MSLLAIATDGFFCPAGGGADKVLHAMPSVMVDKPTLVFVEQPDEELVLTDDLVDVDDEIVVDIDDGEITVE